MGRQRTPKLDKLTKEIQKNMQQNAPGPTFSQDREAVRLRLQDIVTRCSSLPLGTELHVFGSSKNGFGATNSDLDMCLAAPEGKSITDPALVMGRLAEDLEREGMVDVSAR